jgi:hypothetical protein
MRPFSVRSDLDIVDLSDETDKSALCGYICQHKGGEGRTKITRSYV